MLHQNNIWERAFSEVVRKPIAEVILRANFAEDGHDPLEPCVFQRTISVEAVEAASILALLLIALEEGVVLGRQFN